MNPNPSLPRRKFLALAAAGAASGLAWRPAWLPSPRNRRKLIVLGIDGMDPALMRRYVAAGRMPNVAALLNQGDFRELATSNPPQSPVAWSNVISGTNPGGHGLFDFISRDPATLKPSLSMAHMDEASHTISAGKWSLPLSSPRIHNARGGPAFWNLLEKHDIPCTILHMPANFPPTPTTATSLSGMGTPDIHGSYGIFTQYTDAPGTVTRDVSGGRIERVQLHHGETTCILRGPANTLRRDRRPVDIPCHVHVDAQRGGARFRIQNADFLLQEGEWSAWIHLRFDLLPFGPHVSGICRFQLQRVRDGFSLYVTPINMDPADPALPISTPDNFSQQLATEIGPFYTQGMPVDTSARRAGVFDDNAFRHHAGLVLDEEFLIYRHALAHFDSGCFFFYFSTIDLNSHLFWRTLDPQHPLYTPELSRQHADFIPSLYARMDDAIGMARRRVDADTTLVVMSDHGFGSFRRQFNLNSWLMDEGFVTSLDPAGRGRSEFLAEVDWAHTRAYGLGLNALYLNQRGREAHGTVSPGPDRDALLADLIARLTAVRDPTTGARVISRVFRADEIYAGPHTHLAPDLIIGYNQNYRASWDTVLGRFPREQLLDNLDPWSGDHALDPQFVPGILLSTKPLAAPQVALSDLAPTFLNLFNVPVPPEMTGAPVFTPS